MDNYEKSIGGWISQITDFTLELSAKCRDYEYIMAEQNKAITALMLRIERLEIKNTKIEKELEQISLLN